MSEAIHPGRHLLGYRVRDGGRERYIGFVAPFADHVKLGVEYGALMQNEHGLLEGAGKQVRHVVLRPDAALPAAALAALIAEAAMVAATIQFATKTQRLCRFLRPARLRVFVATHP